MSDSHKYEKIDHVLLDMDGVLYDPHASPPRPYGDVVFILDHFRENGIAFSVLTAGLEGRQMQKALECGIDPRRTRVRVVEKAHEKSGELEALCAELGLPPEGRSGLVVVGDRADVELLYANYLKCTAVRMLRGKHAGSPELPHISIKYNLMDLFALPPLLGLIADEMGE